MSPGLIPLDSPWLLALAALTPVLVVWTLGLFGRRRPDSDGAITTGNPLFHSPLPLRTEPLEKPLAKSARTMTLGEMQPWVTGLRHLPVEVAAPLLRHFSKVPDPSVQLYAQTLLQAGRERLQGVASRLEPAITAKDPRLCASLLETGLRLASPTLMAAGERHDALVQVKRQAEEILSRTAHTPRLLHVAARVFLEAGEPAHAARVLNLLPAGTPLRSSLEPLVDCALHQAANAAPPNA